MESSSVEILFLPTWEWIQSLFFFDATKLQAQPNQNLVKKTQ